MGTSHQKGWVSVRGKKWYGYFRRTVLDPETNEPRTVSTPIALGLRSQMTKFEAREKLVEEITRLTGQSAGDDPTKNGAVTFGWFVRNRFFPLKEARWKEETAKVKKLLIQQDLIDEFDDVPLENFDKFTLQTTSTSWPRPDRRTPCFRCELTCGTSSPRQPIRATSPGTPRGR